MKISESELLQITASKILFPDLPISDDLEQAIRNNYAKITQRFNRTDEQKAKDNQLINDVFELNSKR
ncbi:hypothetical protein VB796_06735 [Arcicella sp. LKC2W]|uniref:hypothetical protein n=1 Tax=Arcicella sp. LKC2W TaxID=2984198 RepID=UPI002B206ECF|nr:hypothetical protein [Arcicella sp. LKC2W]MEA5458723.1 hypothetical protein [Arcicella sp. LKC2W]